MVTRPELMVQAEPAELEVALEENDEPQATGIQSLRVAVRERVIAHCTSTRYLRRQPIVFGQNIRM